MRYYSPSTGGFYSEAIHGAREVAEAQTAAEKKAGKRPTMVDNPACSIPADAVLISDERHDELVRAQGEGKVISVRGGQPVAVNPIITTEQRWSARRAVRDRKLAACDWTQLPDAFGGNTDRQAAWAVYRQALRDLNMDAADWPGEPVFEA